MFGTIPGCLLTGCTVQYRIIPYPVGRNSFTWSVNSSEWLEINGMWGGGLYGNFSGWLERGRGQDTSTD